MRPLFDVGEEVILCSKSFPQYNGEYVVESITDSIDDHQCAFKYGYTLYECPLPENGYTENWCQCALRKKPEPGGDFESFMDELKQPIKQPVMVEK